MGITGLIPFLEKASRRANVGEFSGCTVAIDSYCWLHKGAFACADKLVRGEDTDIHIKYCLKYVTMLLSKNIKPILVFDGRHLPAKAMTESKRRESRDISKKRAAELLSLGKIDEARSYMRRSVDITHKMALALIKECRKRNVDCIVAPYEADAQLAYLNIKNIAHLVITEDSDLILFGCTKVLFKMDLEGMGTLVDTAKLPLVMKCPIEHYSFEKFRQMCIMSGCDYLASLPGIGLAKARQFVTATQDPNFANALRKLPSFFNKSSLTVTDEYRESFLKAEATFKHQYVYDPLQRKMVRLTEPDDEDVEQALCVNAGELLDPKVAFQLALGNLDPFTLKKMDDWHPDTSVKACPVKTDSWKDKGVSNHPSIWKEFSAHVAEDAPWARKRPANIISAPCTRPRKKVVSLVTKYVPETQDQSLTIETLSNMYCVEPVSKKQKMNFDNESETFTENTQNGHNVAQTEDEIANELPSTQGSKSPILENKERSYKKCFNSYSVLKRLSKFPRTVLGDNVVESKFFNSTSSECSAKTNERTTSDPTSSDQSTSDQNISRTSIVVEESPEKVSRNPFKVKSPDNPRVTLIDTQVTEIPDSQLERNTFKVKTPSNPRVTLIDTQCIEIPNSHMECKNPFKVKSPNNPRVTLIDTQVTEIPDKEHKNPFIVKSKNPSNPRVILIDTECIEIPDSQFESERNGVTDEQCTEIPDCQLNSSQKENSPHNSPMKKSPILLPSPRVRNMLRVKMDLVQSVCDKLTEDSVIDNTYPMEELVTPVDSQASFGSSPQPRRPPGSLASPRAAPARSKAPQRRAPLTKTASLPNNQPTLLSKFGFQKKAVLKR